MTDRCSTYQGVHIPGCIGCAWFGHGRCTCPPRYRSTENADQPGEDRMALLEERLEKLQRLVVDLVERVP